MARKREAAKRVAEGVYRRGDRYIVPIYDPVTRKRPWHTLPPGTTLTEAKRFKRAQEAAKQGRSRTSEETVAEFAAKWEERFPHRKESTVRHNLERVRVFVRDSGDRPLGSITKATAHDWARQHPSHYAAVRAMFTDALSMELVPANPFSNLRLPQGQGRRNIKILEADEVVELAATAKWVHGEYGEHFADLILTAAWTGLRPGELFALIPERVDLDAGVLHVEESADNKTRRLWQTKTDSGRRSVVVLPEARGPLGRVLGEREPGEFLFQPPNARTRWHREGKASMGGMSSGYYWRTVRDAFTVGLGSSHWLSQRVRQGEPKLALYEMRHVFGTRLAQQGVSAYDIAAMMGHASAQVALDNYIHVTAEDARERVRQAFGENEAA